MNRARHLTTITYLLFLLTSLFVNAAVIHHDIDLFRRADPGHQSCPAEGPSQPVPAPTYQLNVRIQPGTTFYQHPDIGVTAVVRQSAYLHEWELELQTSTSVPSGRLFFFDFPDDARGIGGRNPIPILALGGNERICYQIVNTPAQGVMKLGVSTVDVPP
ncbi:hypothetical protein B0J12DRAFT_704550 [Macrophomina phaseolina]|uniref:Uncharacterized protein n=1 Tax=Macrophomina phaseolina TaxID=35725 RepID=A0ABQ8FW12_9PEZI|nr:hypothetical protein B0J12DRAFT_704550 [Macrophomina phaseolina]